MKFYEVTYEYGQTVPIKATRQPTIQEAAAFCNVHSAGAVVSVEEISADYLLANYNCNGIDDWPVFNRPVAAIPRASIHDGGSSTKRRADKIRFNDAGEQIMVEEEEEEDERDEKRCVKPVDGGIEEDTEENDNGDLLAIALIDLDEETAYWVGNKVFEPMSNAHNVAENWAKAMNKAAAYTHSNFRAIIIDYDKIALRTAISCAKALAR